jgi:tetratricopeptide (TPR) repeat protein
MGRIALVLVISAACLCSCVSAQENGAPLPAPAPPVAPQPRAEDRLFTKKESENLNATLAEARKATAEKRYSDSESLMEKTTRDNPALVLPWVELGLAQLGDKKYPEAENSFKMALGIDPDSLRRAQSDNYYQKPDAPGVIAPSATRVSRNTVGGIASTGETRTPDIQGVSWAGLGEAYAHQGKISEAQAAFDSAVKALPTQAAQYRHNEAVVFFQAGNSDAQLAAAEQAVALDPARAANYYFKAQALVGKATVDSKTGKMVLPPGCAEAYQRYLQLEPKGQFSADAKGVLAAAGISSAGKT